MLHTVITSLDILLVHDLDTFVHREPAPDSSTTTGLR